MTRWIILAQGLALLVVSAGCGKDTNDTTDDDATGGEGAGAAGEMGGDAGTSAAGAAGSSGSGTGATAGSGGSAGTADTAGAAGSSGSGTGATAGSGGGDGGSAGSAAGGSAGSGELFDFRIPQTRTLECTGSGPVEGPQEFADADWLCTLEDGDVRGQIYVQASAVSCMVLMSAVPTYEVQLQVAVGDTVSTVEGATYDSGGNHRNDWLSFDFGGKTYQYDHSSFGAGWHACHPMDCLRITEDRSTDDGCTCDRTHPVVCVQIQADGTHDELLDTFEVCDGDESCG